MGYRFDVNEVEQFDRGADSIGHSAPFDARDAHAGAGACSKCGCTGFENYGANKDQCGNGSCAHSWSDHY